MTDTTPQSNRTSVVARTIEADPIKPQTEHDFKPLIAHTSGVALTWAASILVATSLLPLILEKINNEAFQNAARTARLIAPSWPGRGAPYVWSPALAEVATWTGAVIVIIAISKIPLPRFVTPALSLLITLPLISVLWSVIDTVNNQNWIVLPAISVGALSFICSLWALGGWKTSGSRPPRGAVKHALTATIVTGALLILSTLGAVKAEEAHDIYFGFPTKASAEQPIKKPSQQNAHPVYDPMAQLNARLKQDANAVHSLHGSWVPQIGPATPISGSADKLLTIRKSGPQQLRVVNGRSFHKWTVGPNVWFIIVQAKLPSKSAAQAWCKKNAKTHALCVPRLLPSA